MALKLNLEMTNSTAAGRAQLSNKKSTWMHIGEVAIWNQMYTQMTRDGSYAQLQEKNTYI